MDHTQIKTFEDACKVLMIDATALPVVGDLPEKHQNAIIAHYKLVTIAQAVNEGWEPDWNNWDEYKYYPWFEVKKNKDSTGFGLSYFDYVYTYTDTLIGSRLVFKTSEMAEYIGQQFIELYQASLMF